ncbi:MAG: neuraminidase-like domain-containing protein [Myxococcota bacterium]
MELCTCVAGVVVKEGTTDVVAGATIRLFTREGRGETPLGSTVTNASGRFSFDLTGHEASGSSNGELRLEVYDGATRLDAHGDTRWYARNDADDLVVCVAWPEGCAAPVDAPTGDVANTINTTTHVYGRVLHADATPLDGMDVQLCTINFAGEGTIGTLVQTANGGWYTFGVVSPPSAVDIFVKVFIPPSGGNPAVLVGLTRVHYGYTSGPLRIDVRVCADQKRGPSEFRRVSIALSEKLFPSETTHPYSGLDGELDGATIKQLAWLTGKTKQSLERVTLRAAAARLAAEMNGSTPTVAVEAEAIYGLLRQGFPSSSKGILAKSPSAVSAALTRSREANIIGLTVDITTVLASLQEALGRALNDEGDDALGEIMSASKDLGQADGLDTTRVSMFCTLYAANKDDNAAFWTQLSTASGFTDPPDGAYFAEAKRLVRLGAIGVGHAAVVRAILGKLGTAAAEGVSTWTLTQWGTDVVATIPEADLPDGLTGEIAEQRAELSRILYENAALAFPSTALRSALLDTDPSSAGTQLGVATVLNHSTRNQALDLRTVKLVTGAFDPTSTAAEADELDALRKVQRLYRIAPAVGATDAMIRLNTAGVTSARDVDRKGKSRFVDAYGTTEELRTEAIEIVRKSRSQTGMAAAFFLQAHPALGQASLDFVGTAPLDIDDATEIPGWSGLFTSPTGTRCGWCQSIHGPAAYLVDLLHWLAGKTKPTTSSSSYATALDALTARRPDLVNIQLTCENAERVLPYIDLTLEVLEAAAAGSTITARVSEAETSEMLAAPQYVIDTAYTTLGSATGTFLVPFHQPLHEARAFLGHLGIHRTDLMRAFQTGGVPTDTAIGREELGLSEEGANAITASSASAAAELASYWMFSSTSPTVRDFRRAADVSYDDILDLLHTRLVNPSKDVVGELEVVFATGGDPYDMADYSLQLVTALTSGVPSAWGALDLAILSTLRKVIRIRRATGWSPLELDKVATALGEATVSAWDDAALTSFADVHRLAREYDVDVVELASWCGTIDTYEDRDTAEPPVLSLYDRTFLSRSLFSSTQIEETETVGSNTYHKFPFALNAARSELDTTSLDYYESLGQDVGGLRDHVAKLHAVLGIDESEVTALIEALQDLGALVTWSDVDATTEVVAKLTLKNLTRLYRWCSLARLLDIDPTEAVRLAILLGVAPSGNGTEAGIDEGLFATPSEALAFLEEAKEVLDAGWSVDELDYLLRHVNSELVGPTDEYLQGVLGRLRDTVRAQQASLEASLLRDAIVRQLASELEVERAALDALDPTMWAGACPADEGADFPCFFATDAGITTTGASIETTASLTSITLTQDVTCSGGTGTITSGTTIRVPAGTVLGGLTISSSVSVGTHCRFTAAGVEIERSTASGTAVTADSGTVVTLPDDSTVTLTATANGTLAATSTLVITPISESTITITSLFDRFTRTLFTAEGTTDEGNPWSDLVRTSGTFKDDFAVLEAVYKAVFLQGKLGANEDERAAAYDRVAAWQLLDPSDLLGATLENRATTTVASQFGGPLKALIDLFAQRARIPGETPDYATIIVEPTAANIAARTGWDEDSLSSLVGAGITSVDDLVSVLDRWELVKRAGAAVDTVSGWAAAGTLAGFTSTLSREIVNTARSRYASADAWAGVARAIRDQIRKAQRDALVSYLISQNTVDDVEDADDLYQKYLIDVSMNPEMLTSRIVQASCTVQLFIHRCLFGLEFDGTESLGDWFNDEDRLEWEWMRTYRVWEAARKVFLYPENWIEPELRDDKTPFFKTLEQDLAQGDATEERVEQVLLDYLDRLHDVSSLKILACYVEKEEDDDGTIDNFHVFARSHSDPPTYWYRRREDSYSWTPWEKIDAGLTGDHLVPVVYNRRLMLFWAEFMETNSEVEGASPSSWWEIRLSMSTYRDGKWSPKQTCEDPLSLQAASVLSGKLARHCYGFVATVADPLTITCIAFASTTHANGQLYTRFDEVGHFTLNACTMEIEPSAANTEDATRIALDPTHWEAPGYLATPETDNLALSVYAGDYDATTGDATGTASALTLLANFEDGSAVVPSQWNDFVSQSPFFVSVGERVYFVVPSIGADEDISDEAGSDTPSVGSVTSYRNGTSAKSATSENQAPVDYDEISRLLPESSFSSSAEEVTALERADATLAGSEIVSMVAGEVGAYHFSNHYHPFTCRFIKEVRRNGALGLLDPEPDGTAGDLFRQAIVGPTTTSFESSYDPTYRVDPDYPIEDVDFSIGGAYSQYNWEIFFHLPFYLANRLADAGRFDEAFDWFHAVFDPRTRADVTTSGIDGAVETAQWWKIKPFVGSVTRSVEDWVAFTATTADTDEQASFETQVAEWREDPFNPHLLARLRPGTYQRAFVMRYVDTLIAWGDYLFTKDTIESLNEATQLYVFAKQVLGDRPELIGDTEEPEPKTYDQLKDSLDDFSNALVAIENAGFAASGAGSGDAGTSSASGLGYTAYFCVPFNAKLLSYWDTVEDRLFKIRNGMNIEGVVRSLPLFQPPIDPAMLVRAAAAGVDIGAAVDAATAARGPYRFSVMLGRAQALAGSVKALGQALLGALEKRDAEGLALLRQGHEVALFAAMKGVREQQLGEAETNLAAMKKSKEMTKLRLDYYDKLISKGWLPSEEAATALIDTAMAIDSVNIAIASLRGALAWIPNVGIGVALHARLGGSNASDSFQAITDSANFTSGVMKTLSGRLSTTASYKRREQEWKHQKKLAAKELTQLDKQIEAAKIRVEIAERELKNQELQIKHSDEVTAWMQQKFTNADLYSWNASQLAALHFQAYQLALSTARKAEQCFQHELCSTESFIQAVYWDGTRKGLLAGEKLAADLERMDVTYLDADVREQEITKNVSLGLLDPVAMIALMNTGECYFEVPEALFDLDFPGHYRRRLQSVTVSIACVGGPPSNINATLTLESSKIRIDDTVGSGYAEVASDTRFTSSSDAESIALSGAQDDGGVFQLDPKDPRYLPFERRGSISSWSLRLAGADGNTKPQFDWRSITEVALRMRYTAKDSGATLAAAAGGTAAGDLLTRANAFPGGRVNEGDTSAVTGLQRVFSAKRDFPDEWYEATSGTSLAFSATIDQGMFPYFAQACASISCATIRVFLIQESGAAAPSTSATTVSLTLNGTGSGLSWAASDYGPSYVSRTATALDVKDADIAIGAADTGITTSSTPALSTVDDLLIVIDYDLSNS